jgi:hypothetical protein
MSERKRPRNGKSGSTPTALLWERKLKLPSPELQRLLRAVYNCYQKLDDPGANATARRDFVFHMTDWINDLEQLAALYARPEKFDKATASDTVYGFLIHALPHLMEAGRLLEGREIRNPFMDMESKP